MRKKVCTVQDCHGNQIRSYLIENIHFFRHYHISQVFLNNYVVKESCYSNNTDWEESDKEKIKQADVLILQVIEKDRDFLNNCETIKLAKPDCQIIMIPHYRCSIYNHTIIGGCPNKYYLVNHTEIISKINDMENIAETIQIIKNEIEHTNNKSYDSLELETYKNDCISDFLKVNSLSSIDMSDYFLNNYQSTRLFKSRGYPTSIFLYELTNRVLKQLDIHKTVDFIDSYFAENTDTPISDYWYRFCNFTFENIFYTEGHTEMKDYEFYYMLLYYNSSDIIDRTVINDFCLRIRSII
jgi:hypothetical protein